MRLTPVAALLTSAVALTAAPVPKEGKVKPAELLVGRWLLEKSGGRTLAESEVVVEYTAEGTMQIRHEKGGEVVKVALEGKWEVAAGDDNHPLGVIVQKLTFDGREYESRESITAVIADRLETTGADKEAKVYARVKDAKKDK